MKRILKTSIWIFSVLSVGCTTVPHYPVSSQGLAENISIRLSEQKENGPSENQQKCIKSALGFLPKPVQESVKIVVIYPSESPHFRSAWVSAHCEGDGTMCLRANQLNYPTIWHEAAHAYTFWLIRKGKFKEKEWKNIAAYQYGDDQKNKSISFKYFPTNGILSSYGATHYYEDIAVWMEYIYDLEVFSRNRYRHPLFSIQDKHDPRYLKKLNFLFEEGFISYSEYQNTKLLL